jgi:hypothetical protein
MSTSDLYPCKDLPPHCGWARIQEGPEGKEFLCVYPDCFCGEWLVGSPLNNKTIRKGQFFDAILYRGKEEELAKMIYKQLLTFKCEGKTIPFSDSNYSIHLDKVELVQMSGVYQIDITGVLK